MLTVQELLWGGALPCGIALLGLALLGGWRWGAAVVLAAAYITGHIMIDRLPGTPPVEGAGLMDSVKALWPHTAPEWAAAGALIAALIGVCISCSCVSPGGIGLGRVLLAFGIVNAVLWAVIENVWDKTQAVVMVQAIVAIVLVAWWSVDSLADRIRGAAVPLILMMTACAAALAIALNGSERTGKLMAVMGASLAGAFVTGLFRKSMDISRGGIAVVMTVIVALLLCGVYHANVPEWVGLTILLSPALAWVLVTPTLRSAGFSGVIATCVIVLIALAIAVVPSVVSFMNSSDEALYP